MTEPLFVEEMDMVLDGIINAPKRIVWHLLNNKDATLEELEELFEEKSECFVYDWLQRMTISLAVVKFWYPAADESKYELTPFAKDMIEHIKNFRVQSLATTARKEK